MTVADSIKDAAQSAKEAIGFSNGSSGESKSARKKKAKAEAAAANTITPSAATAVPKPSSQENSVAAHSTSEQDEHLRDLNKQIRNTNKKLQGMQKLDAILEANPGVSLDELLAQRKINQDQKAQAQKKPELQAHLAQLEEQAEAYRAVDARYQDKFTKLREELETKHKQEVTKLREELAVERENASRNDLRKNLLVFSRFLRAAAAKRAAEVEEDSEENRAFEGALLLVYGGDDSAVDAAVNIIEGTEEQVPSIDGTLTETTYAQVKQTAVKHTPFQATEEWAEGVARETAGESGSDPTIANAGLTELEAPNSTVAEPQPEPTSVQGTAGGSGNVAGERWNTDAAGTSAGAEKSGLEESYEIVPRPSEEVDVASAEPAQAQQQGSSWAEESHEAATGNKAGESWDTKAPGETDGSWGAEPVASANGWGDAPATDASTPADDGFSPVAGRRGGRGNGRARGDGEFRGRGGHRGGYRGRGDGENRGRGRGGYRGRGEGGEFRGRGRGPRGGAPAAAPSS
ncbi:hypothetical protein CERZMDRAFT_121037 [Cercospora zeae-maydis SCOH1-5]|uniref:YAG7-like dimerisation domain-containing protein n=1 Tax=Cercospora zeae-maydis SCOH1-5 TaxID=717836 RepID=A0A6A6FIN3_9PEZI|nr:hypothetical protein CERZMDRAFT_121037 [Cercospora zeae-maydis SCOH1-5]